jgi:hypothetical protein
LRTALGAPLPPTQRAWHERQLAAARAALGDAAFAAARREGEATPLPLAIDEALRVSAGG